MKTILLMDIVIAVFGLYLVFIAFQMKSSGKINSLLIAEQEKKKCTDTKAYIAGVMPYLCFFGVVSLIAGTVGILGDVKVLNIGRIWSLIELALFLGALAFFTHGLRKNKDQYFQ